MTPQERKILFHFKYGFEKDRQKDLMKLCILDDAELPDIDYSTMKFAPEKKKRSFNLLKMLMP